MALLDLWKESRGQIEGKQIQQVLAFAGTGKLGEGTPTSLELRALLAVIPSLLLSRYVEGCLSAKFDQSGFVLQDLVNEIGRRLGFEVEHGRYRGTPNHPGHDGLWRSRSRQILVEVKTTDAYRINLDTLAGYQRELVQAGSLTTDASSILIVVGRQDTGDLEAQIRGSPHAWSVRLVSVDALLRLLTVKESVEDPGVFEKIVGILTPQEFTRVDRIVELVFRTAEDIQEKAEEEVEGASDGKRATPPAAFNEACMRRAEAKIGKTLVRASRAMFRSSDVKTAALCVVSKLHASPTHISRRYWFAFHPRHKEQLESVSEAFLVLGCGSAEQVLLIPWKEFEAWLPGMFRTELENRFYWHISIDADSFQLLRKKGEARISLKKYLL